MVNIEIQVINAKNIYDNKALLAKFMSTFFTVTTIQQKYILLSY
jgi:hypothetical protein